MYTHNTHMYIQARAHVHSQTEIITLHTIMPNSSWARKIYKIDYSLAYMTQDTVLRSLEQLDHNHTAYATC